jgi:hypothetical protein
MAGCFGNHPVDRYLEGQLNNYINSEADFETYHQNVSDLISDTLMNDNIGFIPWFETSGFSLIEIGYEGGKTPEIMSKEVEDKFEIYVENGPQE